MRKKQKGKKKKEKNVFETNDSFMYMTMGDACFDHCALTRFFLVITMMGIVMPITRAIMMTFFSF